MSDKQRTYKFAYECPLCERIVAADHPQTVCTNPRCDGVELVALGRAK